MNSKRNFLIGLYIVGFIILFFIFLIFTYNAPMDYEVPVIQLVGFGVLIGCFFYFFLNIVNSKENKVILEINVLGENTILLILICLMAITFYIPSIIFSDIIDTLEFFWVKSN